MLTRGPSMSSRLLLSNLLKMVGTPLRLVWKKERQIMLDQFIASGVVIKNEVINIDSD
jgi:hypothetical protein